ncbi:MAG: hypothetical protein EP343_16380 [Deltaproteobacteria bacterium]|nr:MAG: hypothetical protein EP343_16380 [Deltaproteobacteria bacterium]
MRFTYLLFALLAPPLAYGQSPSKARSRSIKPIHPSKLKGLSPKARRKYSAFGRYVYHWGERFQKKLPKGWRMEWESSELRKIQWQANPLDGFQIQFVHETHKVPVPVPFPDFQNPKGNTELVPKRCSLHFFPRKGKFGAYESRVSRMTPASVVTVTKKAVVLQPNRFLAKEFPCPEILKAFRRFSRVSQRGWRGYRRTYRLLRRLKVRRAKLRRFRNYLRVSIPGKPRKLPWKRLMRSSRRSTLVVHFKDDVNRWIQVHNRS